MHSVSGVARARGGLQAGGWSPGFANSASALEIVRRLPTSTAARPPGTGIGSSTTASRGLSAHARDVDGHHVPTPRVGPDTPHSGSRVCAPGWAPHAAAAERHAGLRTRPALLGALLGSHFAKRLGNCPRSHALSGPAFLYYRVLCNQSPCVVGSFPGAGFKLYKRRATGPSPSQTASRSLLAPALNMLSGSIAALRGVKSGLRHTAGGNGV